MVANKHYEIISRKAAFPNSSQGRIKTAKILREDFENFRLCVPRLPQSVPPLISYYNIATEKL
jgi:hypothetical protein